LGHLLSSLRASREAVVRGVTPLGKDQPLPARRAWRPTTSRLAEHGNITLKEYEPMPGIQISNLKFSYASAGGFRMHIPRLDIAAGECVAIVGPSGSGKTTLLNLVAGTFVPRSGEINVAGRRLDNMTEAARRRFRIDQVGQVFQAFELLEYLSVSENILLPRLIDPDGRKNYDAQQRIQSLLTSVGLQDKADKRPGELSHGERQRVAVCRAMFNRPTLLLADEPTGNLDQANKQKVVELLIRQAREHDSMLLMVTHDHSMLDTFERIIDFVELVNIDPGAGKPTRVENR
jgi:putative ABC transport system ATP-binding protein